MITYDPDAAPFESIVDELPPLELLEELPATARSFLVELLELIERYNEDEPRIPSGPGGGQWTTSGVSPIYGSKMLPAKGGVQTADPTQLENLPADYRAKLLARLQEVFPGMTQEELEQNLDEELVKGLADSNRSGINWYPQAHTIASTMAAENGFTTEQGVGVVAAMSPQLDWGSNVATAQSLVKTIAANPKVDLTVEEAAKVMSELPDGESLVGTFNVGRQLSDYSPREAASIAKTLGKRAGVYTGAATKAGKPALASWPPTNNIEGAVRILRGEDPDSVLGGHKVRSFYNNMLRPGDSGDAVTIDTHAISAAVGEKVTAKDPRMDKLMGGPSLIAYSTKGTYPIFADAYRTVAERHDLEPEQAQAVIWLQWRQEHP